MSINRWMHGRLPCAVRFTAAVSVSVSCQKLGCSSINVEVYAHTQTHHSPAITDKSFMPLSEEFQSLWAALKSKKLVPPKCWPLCLSQQAAELHLGKRRTQESVSLPSHV